MGLSISPNITFEWSLVLDRDLSEAERPTLVFRYLSAQKHLDVAQHFRESYEADDDEKIIATIVSGLKLALVNWRHFRDDEGKLVEFDREKIASVLSLSDLLEVRGDLLGAMTVSEHEKKRAAWRLRSTTDNSANSTVTAAA